MSKIYSVKLKESPFKDTLDFLLTKVETNKDNAEFINFVENYKSIFSMKYASYEIDCSIATEGDIIHHSGLIANQEYLQMIKDSLDFFVNNKTCVGETFYSSTLPHDKFQTPYGGNVSLAKISHTITNIEIGPDKKRENKLALNAKISILDTPEGNKISTLIENNMFESKAVIQPRILPLFEPKETNDSDDIKVKNIESFGVDIIISLA